MILVTGKEETAATEATVCIEIQGERGDTGTRKLLTAKSDGTKFEAGKVRNDHTSVSHVLSLCGLVMPYVMA